MKLGGWKWSQLSRCIGNVNGRTASLLIDTPCLSLSLNFILLMKWGRKKPLRERLELYKAAEQIYKANNGQRKTERTRKIEVQKEVKKLSA
jgi:hypothetical protein